LVFLDAHLDRLFAGAKAINLDIGLTRQGVMDALETLLRANGMEDGVHLRLMVTRGEKTGANQDPRNALGIPTIVILAEWKVPSPAVVTRGLSLATSTILCTPAHMFDMRLNSHSRLNLILALNQAIAVGADEALMLDPQGFVSSCNATNFFWVKDGQVRTSTGEFCFLGVTRGNVLQLCRDNNIPIRLDNFSVDDARGADEAFVTGTFGGLTPVREIDGRALPLTLPGPMTIRLRGLYEELKNAEAAR
jgi:branched-chain amino acid aminotransferase